MINGIKRREIVGKDGKIEIPTSELPEGTIVEVIVLVEQPTAESTVDSEIPQDTTEYLLSNEANRRHLMKSIEQAETATNLISFTAEEWNENRWLLFKWLVDLLQSKPQSDQEDNTNINFDKVHKICDEIRNLPILDNRSPDEIIGYNQFGGLD